MDSMKNLPAGLGGFGTGMSIAGQLKYGKAQEKAANFEADQLEQNAGQQVAAAQRSAMEDDRQAKLAMSRALAVAAASGGGASDPTVINLMASLAGEGAYRGMVDLYQGEEKSRQLKDQASAVRYSGKQAKNASKIGAITTALSGATSLYTKYGMKTKPNYGIDPSQEVGWR